VPALNAFSGFGPIPRNGFGGGVTEAMVMWSDTVDDFAQWPFMIDLTFVFASGRV
jgi:hypothetical protein